MPKGIVIIGVPLTIVSPAAKRRAASQPLDVACGDLFRRVRVPGDVAAVWRAVHEVVASRSGQRLPCQLGRKRWNEAADPVFGRGHEASVRGVDLDLAYRTSVSNGKA